MRRVKTYGNFGIYLLIIGGSFLPVGHQIISTKTMLSQSHATRQTVRYLMELAGTASIFTSSFGTSK